MIGTKAILVVILGVILFGIALAIIPVRVYQKVPPGSWGRAEAMNAVDLMSPLIHNTPSNSYPEIKFNIEEERLRESVFGFVITRQKYTSDVGLGRVIISESMRPLVGKGNTILITPDNYHQVLEFLKAPRDAN